MGLFALSTVNTFKRAYFSNQLTGVIYLCQILHHNPSILRILFGSKVCAKGCMIEFIAQKPTQQKILAENIADECC